MISSINLSDSRNLSVFLGIVLFLILPCCECWLMIWPSAPVSLRHRRHAQPTLERVLSDMTSHPLNRDRPAVTSLGNELSKEDIDKKVSGVDSLNEYELEPLYQLYGAIDGLRWPDNEHPVQQLYLIPNYALLSLDSALELYQQLPRHAQANDLDSSDVTYFDESWFPIMTSGSGAYVFVNLNDGTVFEFTSVPNELGRAAGKYNDLLNFFQHYARLFAENKIELRNDILIQTEQSPGSSNSLEKKLNSRQVQSYSLLEKFRRLREIMTNSDDE